MTRLPIGLALVCILTSCAGPSPTPESTTVAPTGAPHYVELIVPTAPPAGEAWTLVGPASDAAATTSTPGCLIAAATVEWLLTVTNAGKGFHVVVAAFSDDTPGCQPTTDRVGFARVSGPTDYDPMKQPTGQTAIRLEPLPCGGRQQLDIRIHRVDGGDESHDVVVNYGPANLAKPECRPASTTTTSVIPTTTTTIPKTSTTTTTSTSTTTTSVKPTTTTTTSVNPECPPTKKGAWQPEHCR